MRFTRTKIMKTSSQGRQALHVAFPVVAALLAGLTSGCGFFDETDEGLAAVDSVAVAAPLSQGGSVRLTFYGVLSTNACVDLARVERPPSPGDTVTWRFIARGRRGSTCIAGIAPVKYDDSLPSLPARTVVIRAERSNGEPLLRTLQLPLAAPTQR